MGRTKRIAAVVATTTLLMGSAAVGVVAIQQAVASSPQPAVVGAEAPAAAPVDILTVLPPVDGPAKLPSIKKILKTIPKAPAVTSVVAPVAAAPVTQAGERESDEHESERESEHEGNDD